jgi:hypothetical protein
VDASGIHWHFAPVRDIYGTFGLNGEPEADGSDVACFACVSAGMQTSQMQAVVASVPSAFVMDAGGLCSGTAYRRPLSMSVARSFLVTRIQGVSMQQITMACVV